MTKTISALPAIFFFIVNLPLVYAESFIPKNSDIVLYKIPTALLSHQKTISLRNSNISSIDWINRNQQIESLLAIGRDASDPRYFGQAEAIIRPYLKEKNVPLSTRLLWADILQHDHQYNASLTVLDSILDQSQRDNRQRQQGIKNTAYLMRATIYIAQGRVKKAMQNCRALIGKTSMLISITCIAQVKNISGELENSRLLLSKQLNKIDFNKKLNTRFADVIYRGGVESWAYATLGEISFHLTLENDAEKSFMNGLRHKPNDYYLTERYCDLLIEQKRFTDCITLVKDKTHVTPLLLRAAISEANQEKSKSKYYRTLILKKLAVVAGTGRSEHLRDLAIYQLTLGHNPKLAYEYANRNWQTQKQFEDALVVVQAASVLNVNLDSLEAFHFLSKNFPLDSRMKEFLTGTHQKVVRK